MREIRTSGSMRGGRKRTFARRACLLLYSAPKSILVNLPRVVRSIRHRHSPHFHSHSGWTASGCPVHDVIR